MGFEAIPGGETVGNLFYTRKYVAGMSSETVHDPKAYRWYIYYVVTAAILWLGVGIYYIGLGGDLDAEAANLVEEAIQFIIILPVIPMIYLHIKCFFAYRNDAQYLKNSNSDYVPNWVFWAVLHWVLYFIAALVYVDHRRSKVDTSISVGILQKVGNLLSKG